MLTSGKLTEIASMLLSIVAFRFLTISGCYEIVMYTRIGRVCPTSTPKLFTPTGTLKSVLKPWFVEANTSRAKKNVRIDARYVETTP